MKIVYTLQEIPTEIEKSIFLAGPSLRPNQSGISWRVKALQILQLLEYDGVVFVPENENNIFSDDFDFNKQVEWETKCLQIADNIIVYLNRNIETGLLGLTTNEEWGYWKGSGKCILITEHDADKVRYQEWWANELKVPTFHDLYNGIKHCISIQVNSPRTNGERYIPQEIWNLDSFQSWYQSHKKLGNYIESAKVLHYYRIPSNNKVFAFSLWANVYIKDENRFKNNEFVFTRSDISSCLLYKKNENILESEIILVSEFRTPVSNAKGKVYEIPGGSSFKSDVDMKQIIIDEIKEETGFQLDLIKLTYQQSRQLAATILTHKSHLYSYSLSDLEMAYFKSNEGKVFGNIEDTEQCTLHIVKVKDILKNDLLDWSNIGQILTVLNN